VANVAGSAYSPLTMRRPTDEPLQRVFVDRFVGGLGCCLDGPAGVVVKVAVVHAANADADDG
jgi:hypothetical protein